jgi:hypothetical protein
MTSWFAIGSTQGCVFHVQKYSNKKINRIYIPPHVIPQPCIVELSSSNHAVTKLK